jgi:hypothetical protein
MTSPKPDPISDFLRRHPPEPLSKKEARKLQMRQNKRRAYAEKTQVDWREPVPVPDNDGENYNPRNA